MEAALSTRRAPPRAPQASRSEHVPQEQLAVLALDAAAKRAVHVHPRKRVLGSTRSTLHDAKVDDFSPMAMQAPIVRRQLPRRLHQPPTRGDAPLNGHHKHVLPSTPKRRSAACAAASSRSSGPAGLPIGRRLWPWRSRRGPHRATARVLPGPARLPAVRMPSTARLPFGRAGAFRSLALAARPDSRRRCRGTSRVGSHGNPQLDVGDALAENLRHRVFRSGLHQRHDALFFETDERRVDRAFVRKVRELLA